jgi:hypothetical protein
LWHRPGLCQFRFRKGYIADTRPKPDLLPAKAVSLPSQAGSTTASHPPCSPIKASFSLGPLPLQRRPRGWVGRTAASACAASAAAARSAASPNCKTHLVLIEAPTAKPYRVFNEPQLQNHIEFSLKPDPPAAPRAPPPPAAPPRAATRPASATC